MAFPLGAVLAAAPGVLSAAADIIRVIKEKKMRPQPQPESEKLDELVSLIEQQAQVIEELALSNSNLALAVRNNRILSTISIVIAMGAIFIAVA